MLDFLVVFWDITEESPNLVTVNERAIALHDLLQFKISVFSFLLIDLLLKAWTDTLCQLS